MKPVILCLTIFLLMTINTFSQVAQKKQTIAPINQKAKQKKVIPQIKTAVINPAGNQVIAPKDTANAKLADAIIDMVYAECGGTNSDNMDDITRHYKPEIDLFDYSNNLIAHWDFTNGIQNQSSEDYPNDINGFSHAFHVTLLMKIDNAASFTSLKSGMFKIRVEHFLDQLYTGGDDCFSIKNIQLTLKFLNPAFNAIVYHKEVHQYLNLKSESAEFYFSNKNYISTIKNRL